MSEAKTAASNNKNIALTIKWSIAIILPIIVYFWSNSLEIDHKIVLFFTITITALTLWALELLPDAVVAVALPVVYVIAKIGPPKVIFDSWTNPTAWLVLGGLMIGSIMMSTGLARRLALMCISITGRSFTMVLWGILLAGVILAPFIPSVLGRSAIITVICIGICDSLDLKKGSKEGACILFAGLIAVAAPKLAFITGGADVAMGMSLATKKLGIEQLSWGQYALHNFIPAMLYTVISMFCVLLFLKPKFSGNIKKIVAEQVSNLPSMSKKEIKSLALLIILLASMLTDKIHGINIAWIMLLLSCIAYLPGMNILNEESFRKLNLSSIFFVVGCMGIGSAAQACKADALIASYLAPMLKGSELYSVLATYATGCVLNFLLTPLAAYSSFTGPLMEISREIAVDPLIMMYSFGYGLEQYIFPYEYAILLYFYVTGYIKIKDIIKIFGFRMILVTLFIAVIAYPYWKMVI